MGSIGYIIKPSNDFYLHQGNASTCSAVVYMSFSLKESWKIRFFFLCDEYFLFWARKSIDVYYTCVMISYVRVLLKKK